jgi:lipoyl(octanoyl) transferase
LLVDISQLFPSVALGRLPYRDVFEIQQRTLDHQLALREAPGDHPLGTILCVEHDPVITLSRRAESGEHLLASAATLAAMGVALESTDRGGDITYHGPGQLVLYPILDLNALRLGLHDYMRLLEQSVIDTLADFSITGQREPGATGVWVRVDPRSGRLAQPDDATSPLAKVCAFGVRVRKWISMHGLALNVAPTMAHFQLIVPCGLQGRRVTCIAQLLESPPPFSVVQSQLVAHLRGNLAHRLGAHRLGVLPTPPTGHILPSPQV